MNAKKHSLLYLLLALAVFVSSVAWAPVPAAQKDPDDDPVPQFAKKWPTQYSRGKISAKIVGDDLILYGSNLPRDHSFFVKVRRPRSNWERLGVSYSNQRGVLDDRYILPQRMRKFLTVQVCLKDVITNKAYCISARRIGL